MIHRGRAVVGNPTFDLSSGWIWLSEGVMCFNHWKLTKSYRRPLVFETPPPPPEILLPSPYHPLVRLLKIFRWKSRIKESSYGIYTIYGVCYLKWLHQKHSVWKEIWSRSLSEMSVWLGTQLKAVVLQFTWRDQLPVQCNMSSSHSYWPRSIEQFSKKANVRKMTESETPLVWFCVRRTICWSLRFRCVY